MLERHFLATFYYPFGTTFRHQVLNTHLGRIWTTSAQFPQIQGLGQALESGPRTHVLDVFSPLGQREARGEDSTRTPGGASSLNSDRF